MILREEILHNKFHWLLDLQRCASRLGESWQDKLSERVIVSQTMQVTLGSQDTCTSLFNVNLSDIFLTIKTQGAEIHAEKNQGC